MWNELTGIRKQIDYDQVKMEAMHLKKQVENDFLEKEIQDRIRQARLALDLAIGKEDYNGPLVDGKINDAQQRRGNQTVVQNENKPVEREDSGKNPMGATQTKDAGKTPAAKDNKTAPASPVKGADKTPAAQPGKQADS